MTAMVAVFPSQRAMVRLMPSTAMEPFSTIVVARVLREPQLAATSRFGSYRRWDLRR